MYLRQKARLRPELSPKFLSTSGPNPAWTRTRPEKPGPTYNSAAWTRKRFLVKFDAKTGRSLGEDLKQNKKRSSLHFDMIFVGILGGD